MTPVSAVLLDFDGVARIWRDIGSRAAEAAYGLPQGTIARLAYGSRFDLAHHGLLTHEEWVAGVRDQLAAEYGRDAAAAVDLWVADRGEINQPVVGLVRRLRTAGLRVATLTNNTSILDADLATHGINDLFDVIVNSADIGVCKPAPAAYRIAAARIGLPLTATAFSDDDETNVAAAALLGMPAHHYTDPDSLTAWLTQLGIDLDELSSLPAMGQAGPQTALIDKVLALLGAFAAPPEAAAESDTHTPIHQIRYLASTLYPGELAVFLGELADVAGAVADGSSVGVHLVDGTAAEIRVLPPGADVCHAAGHPSAWIPDGTTLTTTVEYLPAWTSDSRRHARTPLQNTTARVCWHLTELTAAHNRGDRIAAAHALDRARSATVAIAAMLARHQPIPTTGPAVGRYLKPGTTTRLTTSWQANSTRTDGLALATAAVVAELRHIRYTAAHILNTDLPWPWDQLTARLRPLLGDQVDLTPHAPHDDALYTADLATAYDRYRPVPPPMAAGLQEIAHTWLHDVDVLELGAGTGRVTTHLANGARTYQAVEFSPAMARILTARALPDVHVRLGDAHQLDLDNNSIDVVVEHEALPFTDDPATALDEIQRVLRPGGLLLRILVHPVNGNDPTALVDSAYREAAFANSAGPLIVGKGTDPLLTNRLAARGWGTRERTLAIWRHTRTVDDLLASFDTKAWPYQHQTTPDQHDAGMAAAHHAARATGTDGELAGTYRLYALVTSIGATS